ncbi:proton-conducting transporter membrane subunit [uncultured Alistipes sp.]|uniref:proton-conducting transporter transmembrane domain-containing protein n=1 Tax=uncultured Alistipes sp. TaxID=538949 RepID=UPI00260977B2|nr:proton-conducting transporter membrane subunit [uncultured Alistipes sp.]
MFPYLLTALAAVAAAIFGAPLRAKAWVALAVVAAASAWAGSTAIGVLADGAPRILWQADGFLLGGGGGSMDTLSALFVLLISLGSVASVLYSHGYLAHSLAEKSPAHVSLHYTALTVMALSMLGVTTSDGGYTFLFFWELMTIASFLLILYDAERRETVRAALAYLIMMHIGFVLLVAGFATLDRACGSADFAALAGYFAGRNPLPLFLVFLLGFGMKAGLFPMHVWLPQAHPAAPSHVSALMSGVMIKTGIYGILRVTAQLADLPALRTAGLILLGCGIATGLWGILLASAQNDIKRLLAYSSIENVGVILIGAGVGTLGLAAGNDTVAACGLCGALLHTFNHSLFKSLLFFGAGNVLTQTRTLSLDALGGLGKHMPVSALLFLAGAAAICALPPLNGFVSELLIYLGLLDGIAAGSGVPAAAAGLAALALIGGLAVLTFTKLYGTVFLGAPRTHEVAESTEVDRVRIAAMALPLAGILLVGLFPQAALDLVVRAAGALAPEAARGTASLPPVMTAVCRTAWLLIAVTGLLYAVKSRAQRRRIRRTGPTWGCGFTAPNVRMQYTGESFAEGLQSVAASVAPRSGEGRAVDKSELFPAAHNFDAEHKDRIDALFAAWWVEMLRRINRQMMRLRTGKVNHYVLFALLFLVTVFLLSVFNLIR